MCFGIKIFPKKSIYVYYLLYQLQRSNLIWIIKITDDYSFLENICKTLTIKEKTIGTYYIVERYENQNIIYKKFKQFQLYKPKKYDYILFES